MRTGAGEGLTGVAADGEIRPFSESFLVSFSKQGLVLILSGVEELNSSPTNSYPVAVHDPTCLS